MLFELLATLGFIFGVLGFCVASYAVIINIAMQKSTHKIQWVPMNEPKDFQSITDDDWNKMDEEEDLFGSEELNTKL